MERRKKILIVDDERAIRMMLKEYLEMEGYDTISAANAEEAEKALEEKPDLLLLDVAMPETDGLRFCEKIRDFVQVPILFLTAREQEADRIKGLRAGGDDYITKPFSVEELLARIEAHLRREERAAQGNGRSAGSEPDSGGRSERSGGRSAAEGALLIDFGGYRILKEGADVGLTKTEFQIAELLFTNKGQVFTKEKIYETVRGFDRDGDSAVITEHIRRIRGKLGTREGKEYIETVWGIGYRWIGERYESV